MLLDTMFMQTAQNKIDKSHLRKFILEDLACTSVTEKDVDILIKTHPSLCNKVQLERSDLRAVFEKEVEVWKQKLLQAEQGRGSIQEREFLHYTAEKRVLGEGNKPSRAESLDASLTQISQKISANLFNVINAFENAVGSNETADKATSIRVLQNATGCTDKECIMFFDKYADRGLLHYRTVLEREFGRSKV